MFIIISAFITDWRFVININTDIFLIKEISTFLGSLTTIFQVFLGYQAGQIIVSYSGDKQRIARLLIWSGVTGAIGIGLCGASKNEGLVPLNKNIW